MRKIPVPMINQYRTTTIPFNFYDNKWHAREKWSHIIVPVFGAFAVLNIDTEHIAIMSLGRNG